ncbi:hypothetical protein MY11210_000911 [Beauveria gryllotalpidicola]
MGHGKQDKKPFDSVRSGLASDLDSPPNSNSVLEKQTLRKFDFFLLPQLFLITILASLDRSNIGNATVFGFAKSLNLQGNEFSNLVTFFYITYIVCDIFWVISIKRFGANRVLAVAIILAGARPPLPPALSTNYKQAMACRLILGAFESGLLPSMIFIISMVWDRQRQAKRVAVVYCATTLSGAFGGLIAYGIQTMGTRRGLEAWRWLFIIEGVISIVVGLVALLTIPFSAEAAWFLSPKEAECMRAMKMKDVMHKGEGLQVKHFLMALRDPLVYLVAISLFASTLPLLSFGTFLPSIILGLGYKSAQANYLTIPVYILATISVALTAFLSDRAGQRAVILFMVPIPVLIGYSMAIGSSSNAVGYVAMILCGIGISPYNCIMLVWFANNIASDHKRSVALPLAASIANISGVLSGQIYPREDGPRYIMGNSIALGSEALALLGVFAIFVLLRRRIQKAGSHGAEGHVGFKHTF